MIQLLGKVLKKRKIKTGKIDNFPTETLSLKVEIKGPARNTFRIPESIRGKTCKIKRTSLKDWTIQKGEYVVLKPEETRECIKALGKSISTRKYKDFTVGDVDGDGLSEITYENPFIKAVIVPHYGARLKELWNKGTGKNEMYGGGFFNNNGYIEIGGIEESLAKQGAQDELWNAYFKRKHIKKNNIMRFKCKLKNSLEMEKRFSFYKKFPGLLETITFFPSDSQKTKRKNKKQSAKTIKLTQTVMFAMGGIPDYRNKIYIPKERELNSYRFNNPLYKSGWGNHNWWDWMNLHYSPEPPLIIMKRENSKDIVILFLDKDLIDFIWIGNKKRTPRLQLTYKDEKIKNKSSSQYNLLITTANKYSFTRNGILSVSKGQNEDYNALCFVHHSRKKNKKQDITIESDGKKVAKRMRKLSIPSISGSFFYYYYKTDSRVSKVTGKLKGKNMKVSMYLE